MIAWGPSNVLTRRRRERALEINIITAESRGNINNLIQNDVECQNYGLMNEIKSPEQARAVVRVAVHDIAQYVQVDNTEVSGKNICLCF